ncbi:MAG: hypothetical protein HN742_32760 [Lentisphaerae bacterium]|jgi:hypothetical protein|nr:hypothetical protein [Lentisphaerota bacterium]MBT7914101.1 hypothetical protein [Candidatus Bathyarchaeota archaeon]MBT4816623.1 hypothetical protein [Lentisphaerota bacterium]MBT5605809.1 hypothetical protein [Lentisphaerota bacterium]MBT7055612.1 hypothetical protein [Lentisphaerota bacterium]
MALNLNEILEDEKGTPQPSSSEDVIDRMDEPSEEEQDAGMGSPSSGLNSVVEAVRGFALDLHEALRQLSDRDLIFLADAITQVQKDRYASVPF